MQGMGMTLLTSKMEMRVLILEFMEMLEMIPSI